MVLTGCDSGGSAADAPTTPTEVARVRLLATVGPTETPDVTATTPPRPTSTPRPTIEASPTAYIGQFLGEAAPDNPLDSGDLPPIVLNPEIDPALNPLNCEILPDEVFGVNWTNEPRAFNGLRCPIQVSFGFDALQQFFESGVMYAREETSEVWAVNPGGLAVIGQHWSLTQPPINEQAIVAATLGVEVPEGLALPEGILLGVWSSVPEARAALGFATTSLQAAPVNLQRFEGGTLLLDVEVGQVFVLLVDGTAYGPF